MVTLSEYHMQRSPKLTEPPERKFWMNAILSIMTYKSSRYISFKGAVDNHAFFLRGRTSVHSFLIFVKLPSL